MVFSFFKMFNTKDAVAVLDTASSIFEVQADDSVGSCSTKTCNSCNIGSNSTEKPKVALTCEWELDLEDYDDSKPSILIVDDNPGIISFLLDDLESLDGDKIVLDDFNVLSFDGINAAYYFEATQHKYQGLNVKYAILDLTLCGAVSTHNGASKYTGVDIYQQLLIYSSEVKVLFYTGNNLNEYIKSNKKIIEQFKELTGGKLIKDFVLFKTALDLKGRRFFLGNWFN